MIIEAKTSLSMQRANVGVLFTLMNENGDNLGEVLIDWGKVPALIDKLKEWYDAPQPKHFHMVLDAAALGVTAAELG